MLNSSTLRTNMKLDYQFKTLTAESILKRVPSLIFEEVRSAEANLAEEMPT